MPRGSHHDETGYLDHDGRAYGLLREDGGRWLVQIPRRAKGLVGQRVRIVGTRIGYNVLDVTSIRSLFDDGTVQAGVHPRWTWIVAAAIIAAAISWMLLD